MKYALSILFSFCLPLLLWSASEQEESEHLKQYVLRAYNYDSEAFEYLRQESVHALDPLRDFLYASSAFWIYQADRVNEAKTKEVDRALDKAIESAKKAYQADPDDLDNQFYLGVGYCNRSRFFVEERKWIRCCLNARKGMKILEELMVKNPDYHDAKFALGVAECFLADAPGFLKPLAKILGFKGSVEKGMKYLAESSESGYWTSVEADYYRAYFYYNVDREGEEAVNAFQSLYQLYPRNPIFGYFLGRSYQIAHQPLDALKVYRSIRDISYEVGAKDIGNWTSYRIGNILHGEHFCADAIAEYEKLEPQLESHHKKQEYFYRLPLKFAKSYHELGDQNKALRYLLRIKQETDSDTYNQARKLRRKIKG